MQKLNENHDILEFHIVVNMGVNTNFVPRQQCVKSLAKKNDDLSVEQVISFFQDSELELLRLMESKKTF